MRKNARRGNRYWKLNIDGGYCDNCGKFNAGFLVGWVNRKTKKLLCPECYEKGVN